MPFHQCLLIFTFFALAVAPFPSGRSKPIPLFEFDPPHPDQLGCENRLCWSKSEKWAVAHICSDEARGLLADGIASCAAVIANRQAHPEIWGSTELNELLRFDQFAVLSAKTRPWEQGTPPSFQALAAVEAFLSGPTGSGCWSYDSFQASTPEVAQEWLAAAPNRHCVLIRAPQALLFFNWRDG